MSKKYDRQELINILTKKYLKAITEDEILIISGREWFLKKHKMSPEEIIDLREEAKSFKSSRLWSLISNDVKFQACRQMLEEATTPDDIVFGKAMLYNLGIIRKFINNIIGL